ncbi:MAG: efflux RND transporter periplasmic adaptor subunit [Balneolaceae bacterium]
MSIVTKRVLTAAVLIGIFGLLAYPKIKPLLSSPAENQNGDNSSANRLQVEAIEVTYESIEDRIFTSGTIRANEVVQLSMETSGIVTDISFEEGRLVEKGNLLLKINDSELQAQKQRASFRLNLAEQREERQRGLLDRGGTSRDEYEATQNEVNVLRSELQLIEAQIDKTELRAPFSGNIGLKYVSEGSYISPNAEIASLQDINPVKVDFSVPERYISRVDVGDQVNFTVQGVDSTFTGEVYAIEPAINRDTRTLQIRAISSNDDGLLYPGAFANITLILDTIDDAMMVPTISLIPELNSQKLFVVRNGAIEEVRVSSGMRTSEKVQVLDGIAVGDTVLTTGLLQAVPGMEVDVVNLEKSSAL